MLTIGLPFYNSERTLADAVRSVLMQTYTEWELILSDDGSTDGSLEIARAFEKMDPRVKVISDGCNRGLSFRLNQLAAMTTSTYLARMDADDMMMPEKIEKQMKVLVADPSIDVIDTVAYIINEKEEPVGVRGSFELETWDKQKVLTKGLLFHPTVIAKTSWFLQNRYDERDDFCRSEDLELWCRTYDSTRFARVYEPLFIYREGKVNVKNYNASARATRNILRVYHKGVISTGEYYWQLTKSYFKSRLYSLFAFFDMHNILSSTRNSRLGHTQKQAVCQVIQQVKSYRQPVL